MKFSLLAVLPGVLASSFQVNKLRAVHGHQLANGGAGLPPTVQKQTPAIAGRERVKIRYGPFNVPGNQSSVGLATMLGVKGEIWNQPVLNVQTPCRNCLITTFIPGLEYPDGRVANVDTGMWLHHMVIINKGPGRFDATCRDAKLSLPHLDVMATPRNSERLFSSGNERSVFDTTLNNTVKAGYYMKKADKFNFIVDLMNQNSDARDMYITMVFEFLPGTPPAGWTSIKPVWLDAAECGTSQVKAPQTPGKFEIDTKPWKANFDGIVMGMGGHLHDGGTHLDIYWNDKLACRADAIYGTTSMMEGGPHKRSVQMGGEEHISAMTGCLSMKEMKKGDIFKVRGFYDPKLDKMMSTNGKRDDVMVISIFLAQVPIEN